MRGRAGFGSMGAMQGQMMQYQLRMMQQRRMRNGACGGQLGYGGCSGAVPPQNLQDQQWMMQQRLGNGAGIGPFGVAQPDAMQWQMMQYQMRMMQQRPVRNGAPGSQFGNRPALGQGQGAMGGQRMRNRSR